MRFVATEPGKIHIRLARLKGFLKVILHNRMAFTGFVILVLVTFAAIATPLLTPYDPQSTVVSGPIAQPLWAEYIVGSAGRSQNALFPAAALAGSGQGFSSNLVRSSDGSVGFTVTADGSQPAGSVVQLVSTLNWVYPGGPPRFVGNAIITAQGVSNATRVGVTVYFTRVGEEGAKWVLWRQDLTVEGQSYTPRIPLDSNDETLKKQLGFERSYLKPSEIIFAKPATYTFSMDLALPAGVPLTIKIQEFVMQIYGNTWGILGTDNQGRDVFTQLLYGARLSLIIGLLAAGIGISIGLIVGLVAGYLKGVVDEVLMRFTDMMLVIPGLPLLIVLVAVLSPSLWNIIAILGFLGWMGFARLVRSQVLSLRERPFIEAAKASGAGTSYAIARHIFPNIVGLTYVNLALSVPGAIVGEAALSFLGLFDPNVITWGRMLNEAQVSGGSATQILWWWIIPPGLGIAILSLSFILLGYALDELFNPRLRRRR